MHERMCRRAGLDPDGRKLTPPTSSPAPNPIPPDGFVSQNAAACEKPPLEEPAQPASRRSEINRANAAHSTGPRTPTGKSGSSRNSLKHGLASGTLIIPGDDHAAFDSLLECLLAEHQPANITEEMLIQEMAQSFWLTQRALRFQNACFTESGIDEKHLALFLRYQTTHERAFHKALNTLIRLQKDRRKSERKQPIGFVSQQHANSALESGFVSQNDPQSRNEPGFVSQTDHSHASEFHFESQNAPPPRPAQAA